MGKKGSRTRNCCNETGLKITYKFIRLQFVPVPSDLCNSFQQCDRLHYDSCILINTVAQSKALKPITKASQCNNLFQTHNLFPYAHFTVIVHFFYRPSQWTFSKRFPHQNSIHVGLHPDHRDSTSAGLISTTHIWINNLLTPQKCTFRRRLSASLGFKIALHKLIQLHEEKTSNSLEQPFLRS